jgi:integrative and conjugative element protein (TIGR02256 family)
LGKNKGREASQPTAKLALSSLQPGALPARGVILPRQVLSKLRDARKAALPRETGGFLIGLRRGPHIDITAPTMQGPEDVATQVSFDRADGSHAEAVEAAWSESKGEASLVGDWHSHPAGDGFPSGTDRQAWRKLSASIKADCVGLVLGDPELPRVFFVRRNFPLPEIEELPLLVTEGEDLLFGRKKSNGRFRTRR